MRIALDAMGGDQAPAAIIAGAVLAVREHHVEIALIGRESTLRPHLDAVRALPREIEVVDAPEVIEMGEHPTQGVRSKRNASIPVGLRLVRDGKADAFVSAGNTGAVMAAALMELGRLEGVERPALAAVLPNRLGKVTLFLDLGANADCRPAHLLQFAQMGSAYMEKARRIAGPRVALLNIGEEETKGNALARETHEALSASALNFIGNIEGREMLGGSADVVVTDGFTGNIALKAMEGGVEVLVSELRRALRRFPAVLPALVLRTVFKGIAKKFDHSEFGGVPLLGINGIVIIAHGGSSPNAISNAVRAALVAARSGVQEALVESLRREATPIEKAEVAEGTA